ncbi:MULTISPECIES: MFS transporter [Acidiplasma]|uniref:Transporter n=2 Tax=Acidiplasma TaxID=507753 RepID=A0A0Q1B4I5_9ARCH|nr:MULTISPECIES: MFS transporter [Acidiplasma]KJE50106.1 transporter [Acidiplasma sp. MBA-1]KPV44028.1 transporter [Acidiplasma aeolicum]KQB34856.1 transporter [Acidiplasma aeolicum]WMT55071.1 MAG: MFS transporter [Acidiplasma sp.]
MLTQKQKYMLLSSSSGLTFWGIVGTLGPLAASGSIIGVLPKSLKVFVLLIGPIFVPFGNFLMGILSDILGRKKIFIITMVLYSAGIVIISLSYTFIPLAIGLMIAEFGVGGEEIPSLSLISEDSPVSQRAKWLTIIADFDNIGSALIAGMFLITSNTLYDRIILLSSAAVLIIIMVFARIRLPESYKWLESRGMERESEMQKSELYIDTEGIKQKKPSYRLSFFVLLSIAISQYTTFGLMAYIIGPYEFPGAYTDNMIIFVALVGASAAGFIAAPLISSGRKFFTLYSYSIGFASTVLIYILVPYLRNLYVFFPLLFINMMMSEFGWASRTTLEPELFPTKMRGTFIGTVRLGPMIVYPILVYATSSFSLSQFILLNVFLWGLGAVGAATWYVHGIETKNVDINY